jgi:hypothetical protein
VRAALLLSLNRIQGAVNAAAGQSSSQKSGGEANGGAMPAAANAMAAALRGIARSRLEALFKGAAAETPRPPQSSGGGEDQPQG